MTWFWPNFKGRILGPCLKDADCYGDICQGNICPGDICSYMQYLSFLLVQFWPNFLDPIFFGSWFLQTKMFLGKTSSDPHFFNANFFSRPKMLGLTVFIPEILLDPKKNLTQFFLPQIFSDLKFFQTQNIFGPKIFKKFLFSDEIFFTYNIFQKIFQSQNFCFPQFFFRKICLNTKIFFQTQNFLPLKIFRPQILQKRLLEVLSSVDKLNN